ncbi:hypothetical protein BCS42_00295 [Crenothrix sp. D3]|nr:hypothetical protein BCS42_00295 [Crenothrix sp. D3]
MNKNIDKIIVQITLVLFPFTFVFLRILFLTNYNFTYTLDDPYIHLALAKNIWLGTYGINIGEVSAPSSSILWPFLLTPFFVMGKFFEFAPLLINLCCLSVLAHIINLIFSDIKLSLRLILIALIFISLNVYGLVFTGMEHSLQILLVAVILLPFIRKSHNYFSEGIMPFYAMVSLILLPLVRYEGLAISVPIILYIFMAGEKKKSCIAMLLLILLMGVFSFFLYSNGLGIMPSSVLSKSSFSNLRLILDNFSNNLNNYGFMFIPVIAILIFFWKTDKIWCFVILTVTCLHFFFGKFGWFGRYENYYLFFIILIGIRLLISFRKNTLYIICFLPFMFVSLVAPIFLTPLAASNIYHQQAQTAQIALMLNEPVAVNDLGLVALRSGQYVLDLWGLGSIEALRYRTTSINTDWLNILMEKKHIKYAFIYDSWFPQKPANWIKVAELRLQEPRITPASDTVTLYAVGLAKAEKLQGVLREYSEK